MIARALFASLLAVPLLAGWGVEEVASLQIAWLKSHAIPLKTVEAGTGFADLQPLKTAIGSARIVSLGEATHGTREIFQMKHRLIEFLASELGFTIFSIEANLPEAYRVNDYVLHGKGDPKALLRGMYFWTWNTEEVLAMIEWMRQFNASGKGRIDFTGFDMQTPTVAMEIVEQWLQKADPELATKVRVVYQAARDLTPAAGGFGVATGTFPVSAAAGKKIRFSGAIKTSNVQGFAGLWWRADGPNGVLAFDNMHGRAPSGTTDWRRYEIALEIPPETVNINFGLLMPGTGAAWFDDLQLDIDGTPYRPGPAFDFDFESNQIKGFATPATDYVVAVDATTASRGTHSLRIESRATAAAADKSGNAADVSRRCGEVVAQLEKARGAYLKGGAPTAAVDWAIQNARVVHQSVQMKVNEFSRDESMARNVKWIVDTAPKGTRTVLWAHNWHVSRFQAGGNRSMGSYLDEWYGKDHLAVGFAIGRGEYTAVGGTGLGRHRLAPVEAGSYEDAFARAGMPRFILDLRPARSDDAASGWLRSTMKLRYIAAMATDQQFQPANVASLFDFIAFLDETTATRTLANGQ